MLKKIIIIATVFSSSSACAQTQTNAVNSINSNSAAVSSQTVNANASNDAVAAAPSTNNSKTRTFLGSLSDKRVEINLTRDGNNLSGIYKYEKIGKDLKIAGTIDAAGIFTLQESDQAGNTTGEWKGSWKEVDGKATLTGKWKSPKGGDALEFSADELITSFAGGAKITTKFSNEENKAKFYEITAEYPELSGVDAAANFNQSVKKIVDAANSDFKQNLGEITTPDDLKRYKEYKMSLYDEITYNILLANDDVISVVFNDANFQGGAHGSSATIPLNFDLKNKRELNLADIFEPNSNYLKTLSELSIADLKTKLQKDEMLDNETLNEGAGAKEENFHAWNLTKKGLLITFDPYQVAAYAAGPQEVTIPYSKLQSILRKDGIVAKIAK